MAYQHFQQSEFLGQKVNRLARTPGLTRHQVELQIGHAQGGFHPLHRWAAGQSVDADQKLGKGEGLGQIVVAARLQPFNRVLFGLIIASLTFGYFFPGLDPILGFRLAYIFTRPLGASFGDLLSQPTRYGGLGLGTTITSALFLAAIMGIVGYMSLTREGVKMGAD